VDAVHDSDTDNDSPNFGETKARVGMVGGERWNLKGAMEEGGMKQNILLV
jgi:hypothetical protein